LKLFEAIRAKRSDAVQPVSAPEAVEKPSSQGVRFEAVALRRDGRQVFDGLSLALTQRRIGLVGDNGSGKSTLLRLANGLLRADAGDVVVNGQRLQGRAIADGVGFVFQNPDHQIIFPTVAEEIAFGLTERGVSAGDARRAADDLLTQHGCAGWADRAIHELSEGQKQLVCILAVIAPAPAILLLDEPFASLDLPTRLSLSARLAQLPQQIVMASHDLDLLHDFDRVVWLERGAVRADASPAEVLPLYRAHAATRGAALLGSGAA
jgi:biotin transport system ATP-binding protein